MNLRFRHKNCRWVMLLFSSICWNWRCAASFQWLVSLASCQLIALRLIQWAVALNIEIFSLNFPNLWSALLWKESGNPSHLFSRIAGYFSLRWTGHVYLSGCSKPSTSPAVCIYKHLWRCTSKGKNRGSTHILSNYRI